MPILTTDGKAIEVAPMPDKVRIYDVEGGSIDVFPVDARECVATGRYFLEPPLTKEETVEPERMLDSVEPADEPADAVIDAPDEPEPRRRGRRKADG